MSVPKPSKLQWEVLAACTALYIQNAKKHLENWVHIASIAEINEAFWLVVLCLRQVFLECTRIEAGSRSENWVDRLDCWRCLGYHGECSCFLIGQVCWWVYGWGWTAISPVSCGKLHVNLLLNIEQMKQRLSNTDSVAICLGFVIRIAMLIYWLEK